MSSGGAGTRREEIRELADAVRELIERMVATNAPLEVFAGVAADVRAVARRFDGYDRQSLYGYGEAATSDGPSGPYDNSPLLGRNNPLAPPITVEVEADRVIGAVTFGSAYEGPPGCVHGGYVAAAFDELLGVTQNLGGHQGMTGRLIVHYRSPTPLHTELRLEGRLQRVDGRKTICHATIHDGERLCAEAEGLFVAVDAAKFAALKAAREERMG